MNKGAISIVLMAVIVLAVVAVVAQMTISASAVRGKVECNDKIDNDHDGKIDLADLGCANRNDNDESNCGDGVCEGGETCSSCAADCGPCPTTSVPTTVPTTSVPTTVPTTTTANTTTSLPSNSCSDTDGGYVLTVKGITSGVLNGFPYSNTDFCISNSTIVENYCTGNFAYNTTDSCSAISKICVNGACV